jgi:translation initiation factor 1
MIERCKGSSMRKPISGGLVYSTEGGRMCPTCRQPLTACACALAATPERGGDGVVRVSRETKGRGGKAVTTIRGVALDAAGLADLGRRLRAQCGAGGTVKDGVIEVQGDHVDRVMDLMKQGGWIVKQAGG